MGNGSVGAWRLSPSLYEGPCPVGSVHNECPGSVDFSWAWWLVRIPPQSPSSRTCPHSGCQRASRIHSAHSNAPGLLATSTVYRLRQAVITAWRCPQAIASMSTQATRSSKNIESDAAASRRITAAGTAGINDRGRGPVNVMPCSRRIQRMKPRLQWSSQSRCDGRGR